MRNLTFHHTFPRDYESTRESMMEREITLWYNEGFLKKSANEPA